MQRVQRDSSGARVVGMLHSEHAVVHEHITDAFVDRLPRDPVQVRDACVALVVVTEGAEVDTIVAVLVG